MKPYNPKTSNRSLIAASKLSWKSSLMNDLGNIILITTAYSSVKPLHSVRSMYLRSKWRIPDNAWGGGSLHLVRHRVSRDDSFPTATNDSVVRGVEGHANSLRLRRPHSASAVTLLQLHTWRLVSESMDAMLASPVSDTNTPAMTRFWRWRMEDRLSSVKRMIFVRGDNSERCVRKGRCDSAVRSIGATDSA